MAQRCTSQMGLFAKLPLGHDTTRPVTVARQLGGPAVECMWAAASTAGQGVERRMAIAMMMMMHPQLWYRLSIGMGKAWIARLVETNGWAIAEGSSARALGRDGRQQAQFATCRSVLRSHGDAAAVPGVWTTRLPPTWSSCTSLCRLWRRRQQSNTPCKLRCIVRDRLQACVVGSGHAMYDTEQSHTVLRMIAPVIVDDARMVIYSHVNIKAM